MRKAVALLVALVVATPAGASFNFIPAQVYFVKNNSAAALSCSVSGDGKTWDAWFALASGGEWSVKIQARDPKMFIRCKPPAAAIAYPLKGGNRYSFLRETVGGPVKLKLITTTKS